MLLKNTVIATVVSFAAASGAFALSSTFDSDVEGWTTNPSDEPGAVSHVPSGGNPDGYLLADDNTDPNFFSYLLAPDKFLVDISRFDGGTIGFDAILLFSENIPTTGLFGLVTISGGSGSASNRIGADNLPSVWTSYSGSLVASDWGVTQPEWLALLKDVTEIRVDLEPILGGDEILGFDNFTISTAQVPLPATGLLLATAFWAFWWVSKVKRPLVREHSSKIREE